MYNSHGNDRALFQAVGPGTSDGVDFLIDIQFFTICDLDFFFVSTVEHSILVLLLWYTRGWIDQADFHYSAFAQIPALQIQYTILKLSELSIRRELLNGLLQQFVCNKPRRALKNLTSISFCCSQVILFWLKIKKNPKILSFYKGESKIYQFLIHLLKSTNILVMFIFSINIKWLNCNKKNPLIW